MYANAKLPTNHHLINSVCHASRDDLFIWWMPFDRFRTLVHNCVCIVCRRSILDRSGMAFCSRRTSEIRDWSKPILLVCWYLIWNFPFGIQPRVKIQLNEYLAIITHLTSLTFPDSGKLGERASQCFPLKHGIWIHSCLSTSSPGLDWFVENIPC